MRESFFDGTVRSPLQLRMTQALHRCRGPGFSRRGAYAGRTPPRRLAGSCYRGSLRQVCLCAARIQELEAFLADTCDADALRSAAAVPFSPKLLAAAARVRDAQYGAVLTFSPKVFIPLTRLCRDKCGYCTFVQEPRDGAKSFLSLAEVLAIARAGAAEGATEALFTLGDAPELVYESAARELACLGHASTVSYLCEAAAAVLTTGLLPHINAGLLTQEAASALRAVSVSQGLMLESTSEALLGPGGAHAGCVTKAPALRLATIHAAGEARVPFTSGILIGIGESRADRLLSLVALRDAHAAHGHLQEVIIQNFRAKGATSMAQHPEPTEEELLWTVAMARLLMPPEVSIQAPPNLQRGGEDAWRRLIGAGINDWGGISTVTRDHVNPEARWPELHELAGACHSVGFSLVPRLAVYPRFLHARETWLDTRGGALSVAAAALRASDSAGLARMHPFIAGAQDAHDELQSRPWRMADHGAVPPAEQVSTAVPPDVAAVLRRCSDGDALLRQPLSLDEMELLFHARGDAFDAVCAAADALREAVCGNVVTYVVNRNINYTDVCTYGCTFCAFSKTNRREAYLVPPAEVARRALEAWGRGATEVCLQGGIHPEFSGDTYLRYVDAVKAAVPDMHVHAFSPLEVRHGAESLGMAVPAYLRMLKAAGLASLPGTAAEILDERVRRILCPDKLSTAEWCDVIAAAHGEGLTTTSTCMFGHCERGYAPWATHLAAIRRLAVASPGLISEYVPLPFVAQHAPLFRSGLARLGPTLRECVLMHAVARLALHGAVRNVQCSWVKMGPANAALLLKSGCNDMGGTLMNESISRAAGAAHGQELPPEAMEAVIAAAGRPSRQRTTLYGLPPETQTQRSFGAAPLSAVVNPPAFV
jgi:FO synthase